MRRALQFVMIWGLITLGQLLQMYGLPNLPWFGWVLLLFASGCGIAAFEMVRAEGERSGR